MGKWFRATGGLTFAPCTSLPPWEHETRQRQLCRSLVSVETHGQKQITVLTPHGWDLTEKISVLQSRGCSMWSQQSCTKERMLRAGLEHPGVAWSPPRAPSAPTAVRVLSLPSQQAFRWSTKHPLCHLQRAGVLRAGGAGRAGEGRHPESCPRAGGQWPGSALAGEGHGPSGVGVGASTAVQGSPIPRGRAAAVPGPRLASPLWYSLQHCRQLPAHSSPRLLTSLLVLPGSQ